MDGGILKHCGLYLSLWGVVLSSLFEATCAYIYEATGNNVAFGRYFVSRTEAVFGRVGIEYEAVYISDDI